MSQTEVQLIKDSTIVNADISNSAAIDVSKVTGAMPLAGGSFTNDVTFTGDSANIVFDKSDNALEFADSAKAIFGTGNDLQIIHDGSNSFIAESGTGNLVISTTAGSIRIEKNTGEPMIHANVDGAVELYHDNSKKFETTSGGATVTGRLLTDGVSMGDSEELLIGTNNDFKFRHDGTDNHIVSANGDINIQVADSENAIIAKPNGAVELYHNNVKKIETTANGIEVTGTITDDGATHDGDVLFTGASANVLFDKSDSALEFADNAQIILGSAGDCVIKHDGSNTIIQDQGTGNLAIQSNGAEIQLSKGGSFEHMVRCIVDGAVELYHNGSKKAETYSAGLFVTGTLTVDTGNIVGLDNAKLKLGTSDDLQLFHDGTNSHITNSTGNLLVASGSNINLRVATSENAIVCTANGAVEIYHNNTKKFETTSGGVLAIGDVDSTTGIFERTNNGTSQLEFSSTNETKLKHLSNGQVKLSFIGVGNAARGSIDAQSGFIRIKTAADETGIICRDNSSTDLHFDDTKKFETTSSGVLVQGRYAFDTDNYIDCNNTANTIEFVIGNANVAEFNSTALKFADSKEARFGAGSDLSILHNGSDSLISNTTGVFFVQNTGDLRLRVNNTEAAIHCVANGAVELYHDNSLKLDTRSSGVGISGDLFFADSSRIYMGSSNDFQLFHDGTNTHILNNTGNLVYRSDTHHFKDKDNSDTHAKFVHDGAVELYHDGSKKFETTSSGVTITGTAVVPDGSEISLGSSNDLIIRHISGSRHEILGSASASLQVRCDETLFTSENGNEDLFRAVKDGAFAAYFDGSRKMATNAFGVTFDQNISVGLHVSLEDNGELILGNGSDYKIFHDGSHTRFDNRRIGSATKFRVSNSSAVDIEALQILSNGKVLINRTNEDGNGVINLALNSSGHGISTRTAVQSTRTHLDFGNQNGTVGSIQTNGSSTAFNTTSDYRLKENAVAISDGITRLKTLKPYRFNFKADASTTVDGFFAHEVTAVPESISGTKDAVDKDNNPIYQGIDQSKLVPLLVAAVQELIGKVEALEAA